MNKSILIFLLGINSNLFAAEFIFPNVEYSFARIFLFNIPTESATERPEFSIFRNDMYAASKLGEGWDWTTEMNLKMNILFKPSINMMMSGLSSCFTPRHGIIYFDSVGNPLASISICFECQRVVFWSSKKMPEFSEPKSNNKEIEKAEKQFADLEKLLIHFGIPVFENNDEYISHIQTSSELYDNSGEIIFDFTNSAAFENKSFSSEDVKRWITYPNFKFTESVETEFSQRDYDTTNWKIKVLTSPAGSKITFSREDENGALNTASILDPAIKLPNGISVGMSLSQIQSTFEVWDGMAYPETIVVNYANMNIRYTFKNRTLRRIEIAMI